MKKKINGNCTICGLNVEDLLEHHINYKRDVKIKVCRSCHGRLHTLMNALPRRNLGIPIEVKCLRCGYEWTYRGKNPYYAPCPKCLRKVKIGTLQENKGDLE
jgi:hypothetical protein